MQRKTCVLLYSRRHFDPEHQSSLMGSSAGQIASALYQSLIDMDEYEVSYFDSFDHLEWHGRKIDLLVTLVDNLDLAKWYFRPTHVVVIAVNQHPLERFRIAGYAHKLRIPLAALSASDGVYQSCRGLASVDTILCVGNSKTLSTYSKYINSCTIYQTSYGTIFSGPKKPKLIRKIRKILILMSSIGYRKGFDRLFDELITNETDFSMFEFHIIGNPESAYWQGKITELTNKKSNIKFHGWILNNTPEFDAILNEMDLALFPTREEGLVGSLLECIDLGILSLHTVNSGLNNSLPELELSENGSINLISKLTYLAKLSPDELGCLRSKQANEKENQFSQSELIGDTLKSCLKNENLKSKGKLNFLAVAKVWHQFPKTHYAKLIINRVRFTEIRIQKAKLQLRFPLFYKVLKDLRATIKK